MENSGNTKNNRWVNSFIISAIIAIIFITVATVLAELYSPFKDWLKNTFYHHWMGKGIIAILLFYIFGLVGYFSVKDSEDFMITMLKVAFWVTLAGVFVITGFYLYEYFLATHY